MVSIAVIRLELGCCLEFWLDFIPMWCRSDRHQPGSWACSFEIRNSWQLRFTTHITLKFWENHSLRCTVCHTASNCAITSHQFDYRIQGGPKALHFLPRCIECNAVFPIAMPSVRPSVCPSVRHMRVLWQNESSADILIPYERKIRLIFRKQRMVGGYASFYLKFWLRLTHPASKTAIVNRYSLVPPQTLRLAKKKLWLIGTQYELSSEPKMNSLRCSKPPKGGRKTQIGHFVLYNVLVSKKVCCKVSLCENCQLQSCKAFTGLSVLAQTVGGGCPLLPEIFDQSDPSHSETATFKLFSLVPSPSWKLANKVHYH